MAVNPQELTPQLSEQSPVLRLVPGAMAVEQAVQQIPDLSEVPEDEFKEYIHGLAQTGDPAVEIEILLGASQSLSTPMAELNTKITELTIQLDRLYKRKVWISGYVEDRRRILRERES